MLDEIQIIRKKMDAVFSLDTAPSGTSKDSPASTGHCVVVSLIILERFGGSLVSTNIHGVSHWFNRIDGFDIDVTADQFDLSPPILFAEEGQLYAEAKERNLNEINKGTHDRITLFKKRMDLTHGEDWKE